MFQTSILRTVLTFATVFHVEPIDENFRSTKNGNTDSTIARDFQFL